MSHGPGGGLDWGIWSEIFWVYTSDIENQTAFSCLSFYVCFSFTSLEIEETRIDRIGEYVD